MAFETVKIIKDYDWGCGDYPYVEITDPYDSEDGIISCVHVAFDEHTWIDSTTDLKYQAEVLEGYADMFLKAAKEIKEQQRQQHLKQMAKELEDKNEPF